jgi:hypothetical protein
MGMNEMYDKEAMENPFDDDWDGFDYDELDEEELR